MKAKLILAVSILLIGLLSGCIGEKINGTYVSDREPKIILEFMEDNTVLVTGENTNLENYKIEDDTVIISYFGMAYVLKIQDNGKTLVAGDGTKYTKVEEK